MKTSMLSLISIFIIYLCMSISAQSPGRQGWASLAEKSSNAVVGLVESESLIIRRDRIPLSSEKGPKGEKIATLANPKDYVVGRLVYLRIEKLIKKSGNLNDMATISIFLPGSVPTEGKPVLLPRQKYLILLSPLKAGEKEYQGATIYQQNVPSNKEKPFDPTGCFIVVGDANGVEAVTSKNQMKIDSAIKEIRAVGRKESR